MNDFQGAIPEQSADYGNLTLIDISVNHLSGFIPDRIGELYKLEVLILSFNNLHGGIPANYSNIATLSHFAGNENNFSGPIPSGLARYLKALDLSYNKNISQSLIRLRLGSNTLSGEILYLTCGRLTYLELENNSFSRMIPQQLGSCQNLTLLNLSHNKLKGPLPGQLANLRHLQVMMLEFNKLSRDIPTQFWQLQVLYVLNISCNSLTSSIPSSISYLQTSTNFYLQGNNLSSTIPNSISYMGSLIELQLGENSLSEKILMMPTKLQIALNLSSNLFEGFILDSLKQLTGLGIFNLSNNKFSGEIPDFWLKNNPDTFGSYVPVNISGNPNLRNVTTPNIYPEPAASKEKKGSRGIYHWRFVVFLSCYFFYRLGRHDSFNVKTL
ncbi:hypothetical protein ACOSQ4_009512 [Xanthoceras sorbifolium]